jgi:hypothetical protein
MATRKKVDTPNGTPKPKRERVRRRSRRGAGYESWASLLLTCASIVGYDTAIGLITSARDAAIRSVRGTP